MYFDDTVQNAIVKYNNSDSQKEKNILYAQ
jgi:hypothetical protein